MVITAMTRYIRPLKIKSLTDETLKKIEK
jgi:hypothetical protein